MRSQMRAGKYTVEQYIFMISGYKQTAFVFQKFQLDKFKKYNFLKNYVSNKRISKIIEKEIKSLKLKTIEYRQLLHQVWMIL